MKLTETLAKLTESLERAKKASPLASAHITLLAASKTQPAEVIEEAIHAGIAYFGENRVQEAEDKWLELKEKHPNVELHLIGPLQTNKVKQALNLFDVIQTLDRPKLADEIASHVKDNIRTKAFYIQVNIGEEPQKSGVMPSEADAFIQYCKTLGLNVVGLMCVPPAELPAAPYFAMLGQIGLRNNITQLSMGMSDDYDVAVRMGSSCVRIGTALFGART